LCNGFLIASALTFQNESTTFHLVIDLKQSTINILPLIMRSNATWRNAETKVRCLRPSGVLNGFSVGRSVAR